MRPIKFRGLDEDGVFHYGNLLQSKPYEDGRIDCYIQPKSILCLGAASTPTSSFIKVKESSVDLFTGKTDRNDVDIYERDIVKDDMGYNRLITIDSFGVDAEGYDSGDYYLGQVPDTFPWAKFEVIGNEHQSPELMESK